MNAPVGPPAPKAAPGERAPKRALTSYMVFVKETRPDMVKNNPTMTVREIVSNLAKQWREMDDEAKKPYETVAVADKIRADKERADWVAAGKEIPKRRKKQKRKHKKNKNNEKKVKRVSSAYIFFSVAQRPNIALANPTWQMGDVSKELGRRWREMTDAEKAPYIQKHEVDKERHRVETEREQEAQRAEAEKQQARDLEAQAAAAQAASQQQAALQQQFAMQQQQQMMQQQMAMQQLQGQGGSFPNQQLQQQAAIQQQLQLQMQQFQQAQMAQLAQMAAHGGPQQEK